MELQKCPGDAETLQTGPKTHGRVLWTFTEHNTGISWVLRAGLTPAALHPHCLVSAKSIPHLAPAKALVTVPSTPGLSKYSPSYFLSALSQILQAQLETHPCCSKAQPNSIPTLKSAGQDFPRPFSPFCTLIICHMPQSLTLREHQGWNLGLSATGPCQLLTFKLRI